MTEPPSMSDGELIRRMRSGSEQAFIELYRRHQGVVFRFATRMSGQSQIGEEVTQDVFLALLRDPAQYDAARGALPMYLLGLARNFVLRTLERDRRYVLADEDQDVAVDAAALDAMLSRERVAELRRAIASLPVNYREVIALCDLEEMDYESAAAVLGCAVGTVRSRLHRARQLLIQKMRSERCPV